MNILKNKNCPIFPKVSKLYYVDSTSRIKVQTVMKGFEVIQSLKTNL